MALSTESRGSGLVTVDRGVRCSRCACPLPRRGGSSQPPARAPGRASPRLRTPRHRMAPTRSSRPRTQAPTIRTPILGVACTDASPGFRAAIAPILAGCAGGELCHGFASPPFLYGQLVGATAIDGCDAGVLVDPGNLQRSYLLHKVTGNGMCPGSQRMPPGGSLATAFIQAIARLRFVRERPTTDRVGGILLPRRGGPMDVRRREVARRVLRGSPRSREPARRRESRPCRRRGAGSRRSISVGRLEARQRAKVGTSGAPSSRMPSNVMWMRAPSSVSSVMRRSSSMTPSERLTVQSSPPGSTLPRSRSPSNEPPVIGKVTRVPWGPAPMSCVGAVVRRRVIRGRDSHGGRSCRQGTETRERRARLRTSRAP